MGIIGIVLIAILLCVFKDDLKKWEKVLLISCIVLTILFIVVLGTNSYKSSEIWQFSRDLFFMNIIITIASLLICTVIAKKNNEKLKRWVKVLQVIGIIIIICVIAGLIGEGAVIIRMN